MFARLNSQASLLNQIKDTEERARKALPAANPITESEIDRIEVQARIELAKRQAARISS